ncbi:MAG: SH3 domain-containing protein [Acidobacteriota bacterium]|nr:SH3 domain-containing protein [Acidobacteriota bacterium]
MALFSPVLCDRVAAQEVKLYPVDEAARDASFKRFRERLILALKRRDRKFLLGIVHPEIQNNIVDGHNGIEGFIAKWKLNSPDSKVWTELLTTLSLGGSFEKENGQKLFVAPYVTSRWGSLENKLPRDADAFTHSAIIAARVPVYSKPDAAGRAVAFLSYDVVEVDNDRSVWKCDHEELRWAKIKTLKGQEGYVLGNRIRAAVDYRAYFKKVRGKWMMNAFLAGD